MWSNREDDCPTSERLWVLILRDRIIFFLLFTLILLFFFLLKSIKTNLKKFSLKFSDTSKKKEKTFTKIQRLFSDDKPSETFNYSRTRPAHRWISNSGYVSLIRALSYHSCQKGLPRKYDREFPFTYNRIEDGVLVLGQSYRALVPEKLLQKQINLFRHGRNRRPPL